MCRKSKSIQTVVQLLPETEGRKGTNGHKGSFSWSDKNALKLCCDVGLFCKFTENH